MKNNETLIFDRNGLFAFLLTCARMFETRHLIDEGKEAIISFAGTQLKRFGNFNELSKEAKEKCTLNLSLYLLGNENNTFSKIVNENSCF